MARLDSTGAEAVIKQMRRLGQQAGPVAAAVLAAGAVEVRDAWRETIRARGYVDTGAMLRSISFPARPKDNGGILSTEIAPKGKDASGTRNAEKAFILHYGTSRIPASYWVDEAEQAAEPRANARMTAVWDEYMRTGTVPAVDTTDIYTASGKGKRRKKTTT